MITDRRYEARLFLEGHSCPVMSISCSTAMNTSAQIEVLATKEIRRLKPSTLIVVGYRDTKAHPAANPKAKSTQYSVMFIGMLTELQLSRGATQRTATLTCAGHAKLLERFYTFIADASSDGLDRTRGFVGAAGFLRAELKSTGMALAVNQAFTSVDGPTTPGLRDLTGPARGAVKLIELCMGAIGLPTGGQQQGAQHEYFSHALAHTRFLLQIGAIPMDDSIARLVGVQIATKTIESQAAQFKMTVSLRTVLDMVLRELYYDIYPTCTPYAEVASIDSSVAVATRLAEIDAEFVAIASSSTTLGTLLEQIVDTTGDTTALTAYRGLLLDYLNAVPDALRVDVLQYVSDQLIEYANGPLDQPIGETTVLVALGAISQRLAAVLTPAGTSDQITRVMNYLLLPDLSFCTPPACNVLFPNQVFNTSVQLALYDRPTRLLLHAGVVQNADAASTRGYYAPSVPEFISQQGGTGKSDTYIPLLPHEVHTGIVPAFESFAFLDKVKTLNTMDEDEALTRIANFNLMRKRYESSTISVSGVFNPFACPGFPIAVIDPDDNDDEPTIFIGLLKSVAHSYSGSGQAMTSYTITHARDAQEVDELFTGATTASLRGVSAPATSSTYVQISNTDPDTIERANTACISAIRKISLGVPLADIREKGHAHAALERASRTTKLTIHGQVRELLVLGMIAATMGDFTSDMSSPDTIEHVLADGFAISTLDVASAHADLHIDTSVAAVRALLTRLHSDGVTLPDMYFTYLDDMGREFGDSARISEGKASSRNINGLVAQTVLGARVDQLTVLEMLPLDFDRIQSALETGANSGAGGAITFGERGVTGLTRGTQASQLAQSIVQEELYRPAWYSESFSSARIGRDVYINVLGTDSVQGKVPNAPKKHVVPVRGVNIPVTSTYDALRTAYGQYRVSSNKGAFVRNYIGRPIANIADVLGTHGLLTGTIAQPPVVTHGIGCGPVAKSAARTSTLTYSTQAILDEKDAAAKAYIASTRKEAFR